ncbi:hypothetical protein [Oryzifoliimicrobium ureilyticus]|uniref:hypothetical protein n=1 Tax=Oryzifoliimicrobium ureilyticus TaxID=3113724 RepID=UPI0030763E4C
MATQMESHVERKEDGRLHIEQEISPVAAKQGNTGKRILTVLISALVLAFIVWIPVEIWGNKQEENAQPQSTTQSTDANKPSATNPPAQPLGSR